jgi:hypothetical protein
VAATDSEKGAATPSRLDAAPYLACWTKAAGGAALVPDVTASQAALSRFHCHRAPGGAGQLSGLWWEEHSCAVQPDRGFDHAPRSGTDRQAHAAHPFQRTCASSWSASGRPVL